jgi:hypothetical protein
VNRMTRNGDVLAETEHISVEPALKAFTIHGAYGSFEERNKGSIAPQTPADVLILSDNPLTISKFKFFGSKCLQVVRAKFIFADKCLGRNDVGHHFLIQRVYDGTVQPFGNGHNHKGLI